MSKLYPVGSMILIEPVATSEKTASGLFIPHAGRERPAKGKVIQVPVKLETVIKQGDTVFFPPNALKQFVVDDETFSAVNEENIYCYHN